MNEYSSRRQRVKMKNYKVLSAFFVLFMCISFLHTKASAEILEQRFHKNWSSFILAHENGTTASMSTPGRDGSLFVIDFINTPNGPSYTVKMIKMISGPEKDFWDFAGTLNFNGIMRVDNRKIYDVKYTASSLNDVLFVDLFGEFNEQFLYEAQKGIIFRYRIDIQNRNPIIGEYSLIGFTEALNRCSSLLKILDKISSQRNNDINKFIPTPPRDTKNKHNENIRNTGVIDI